MGRMGERLRYLPPQKRETLTSCGRWQLVARTGNNCNEANRTLLGKAAYKGNIDVVRLLIERGAEVDSRDWWGWTPLHPSMSIRTPRSLAGARRSRDHGTNVNARQVELYTPIHLSAANGHLEIVKLVLEHDADVLHAQDAAGKILCHLLLLRGNRYIAELLREHGTCRETEQGSRDLLTTNLRLKCDGSLAF